AYGRTRGRADNEGGRPVSPAFSSAAARRAVGRAVVGRFKDGGAGDERVSARRCRRKGQRLDGGAGASVRVVSASVRRGHLPMGERTTVRACRTHGRR